MKMHDATELQFGLKRDEIRAPALWGCRAIYSHGSIDILWDRQGAAGSAGDLKELTKRVNAALPALRKHLLRRPVLESTEVEVLRMEGVAFHVSTNRSFGYLYITAHLDPLEVG